jgi:bifunctional DNase/RNase
MIRQTSHPWIRATTAALLCCLALSVSVARSASAQAEKNQVRIQEVEVVLSNVGPIVLLKAESKAIPVFVDQTVAESIHAALSKQKLPRPLSHDLMRSILQAYDGKVVQVVVTLKGSTFYGALTIEVAGTSKVFDSRSSDAIALAIHFAAPIWVSRELLEKSGKPLEKTDDPPGTQRL